jgi:DNA-binding transcriptional ArsR family regulator
MNLIFEALAHPTRRAILEMLKGGSRSAGELADSFQVSKPTMSAHFAKLREAGLIQADQRGTSILYSLNLSTLEEVLLGFMGRLSATPEIQEEMS